MSATVMSLQFIHIRSFSCRHRRSQGGLGDDVPHKFLEHIVICTLRGSITNKTVIRLKSSILSPPNFFPANFWAGHATACRDKSPNLRADCFTVGLYRVIITWQQIFKCSLQVRIIGVLSHVTLECRHLGR